MFARIVGVVCYIIKRQPWIVAVVPVLRTTNVLQITNNRQREGPAVKCRLMKIIVYLL